VGEADGLGDDGVKDCRPQLDAEEVGVMGEERGLQVGLDAGEIDAVVFHAGVVAHDEEAERGEKKGQDERTKKAQLSQKRVSPVLKDFEKILKPE
jgi:hypothetical protein